VNFSELFFCDVGKSASRDADVSSLLVHRSLYIGLFSYEKSPVFAELVEREDAFIFQIVFLCISFRDADVSCVRNIFGSLPIYTGLFSYEKGPVLAELVEREDAFIFQNYFPVMYASLFPFTQVSFHMKSLSIYTGLFSYEVSFHLHRSLFI